MPKLKQIGSSDGGFSCKGCYYYNIVNPKTDKQRSCVRPDHEINCVVGKAGAPQFTIFVRDTNEN